MDFDYWLKQDPAKPLSPDIEWSKPGQKAQAGRLTIIGGNKHGFAAVAESYNDALKAGVGAARVILPNSFARTIPTNTTDTVFVPTNPSGGMSQKGFDQLKAGASWGNATLLIGDSGRNSETAIMFEALLRDFRSPFVITRDAIDLVRGNAEELLSRDNTCLVASFAQVQKLLQSVYFPKQLLFSMQLLQVVEVLHKLTLSYPVIMVTFHQDQLMIAHGGQIITMPFGNPMSIWRGAVATKAAVYWLQHPAAPLQAIATSWTTD